MEFGSGTIQQNTAVMTRINRVQQFTALRDGVKKASHILNKSDVEAKKAKLLKASKDFEGILVKEILKSMRSTLTNGGMFGTGTAGEIYSDMMDDAVANKIASRGKMGLADVIYKQMVKSIDPNDGRIVPIQSENNVKEWSGR
ncbi:rod-binding protein [Candidatus Latescibacterota bacterium]